jgi:hypothetical protein
VRAHQPAVFGPSRFTQGRMRTLGKRNGSGSKLSRGRPLPPARSLSRSNAPPSCGGSRRRTSGPHGGSELPLPQPWGPDTYLVEHGWQPARARGGAGARRRPRRAAQRWSSTSVGRPASPSLVTCTGRLHPTSPAVLWTTFLRRSRSDCCVAGTLDTRTSAAMRPSLPGVGARTFRA